ncbi:Cif family virulence factor [Streptomyces reniochalinae]|uniref:hypothetical protein n=1 Tax=Streptomyces reniochalinae TaxID=2250578 RepID=UPI001C6921B1
MADTPQAVARANADFLALGLPLGVRPRHTYVADGAALLVVDWEIDGTGPDGARVHLTGTATDVARRGADGHAAACRDRNPRAAPPGRRIA